MKNKDNTELFESMAIPKAVMTLSVPTIISSLVMVIYNLADTYFVGMLNNSTENAAVTLAAPVLLAFNAVNNLFGVGTSSMMSRALGRKDYDTVKKSSAFGFYCSLFFALMISVFYSVFQTPILKILGADGITVSSTAEYLKWTTSFGAVPAIMNVVMAYMVRSEGYTLHAGIGTMSGCILNIILDPIFILPRGLDMGASGAGLATFISNCAACVYFAFLLRFKKGSTYIRVSPKEFHFNGEIAKGICIVGIPAAIQNLLNVTGMTVLNNFTSVYRENAVAAMGIAQKINMIPLHTALGLSQGLMPLVSYNYSSGNTKRMKGAVNFSLVASTSFLFVFTAVYFFFSENLISAFIENENVVAIGSKLLRGMCLSLPFLCIDFVGVGVYQACGMGMKSLVFAIFRKIVLEIPALIILNRVYPLYGLSFAQPIAEFILAVAAVFVLSGIYKKLEKTSVR